GARAIPKCRSRAHSRALSRGGPAARRHGSRACPPNRFEPCPAARFSAGAAGKPPPRWANGRCFRCRQKEPQRSRTRLLRAAPRDRLEGTGERQVGEQSVEFLLHDSVALADFLLESR